MIREIEIIRNRSAVFYPDDPESALPVVYLNTASENSRELFEKCLQLSSVPFALVVVRVSDWYGDMSPWEMPPVSLFRSGCAGNADRHLDFIVRDVMPAVSGLPFSASRSVIAGYSLAGLFAVYSLCRTNAFSEAVSASGSLWYPGFTEFVKAHGFTLQPDYVYLSLGDREAHTKNRYMKNVGICTREIYDYCSALGIDTEYVTEKGNHFSDADGRLARGIACSVARERK